AALCVLTRRASFGDTRAPVAIVAADEKTGSPVVIEEGSLAWAVRCSMAVPGLFQPLERDGVRLVDGGSAWPLSTRNFGPGRRLVVVHCIADPLGEAEGSGFSSLQWQLARLAGK